MSKSRKFTENDVLFFFFLVTDVLEKCKLGIRENFASEEAITKQSSTMSVQPYLNTTTSKQVEYTKAFE